MPGIVTVKYRLEKSPLFDESIWIKNGNILEKCVISHWDKMGVFVKNGNILEKCVISHWDKMGVFNSTF